MIAAPAPARPDLTALIKQATEAFDKLTPAEQAAHRAAQRDSWVRGEMALGEGKYTIDPKTNAKVYASYADYCIG
jgi:hypothetical protein